MARRPRTLPDDDHRCSVTSEANGGRCPGVRLPGSLLCRKHHLSYQLSSSSTSTSSEHSKPAPETKKNTKATNTILAPSPLSTKPPYPSDHQTSSSSLKYLLVPREGEIWAVQQSWKEGKRKFECLDIVEIVPPISNSNSCSGASVRVARLKRVDGYSAVGGGRCEVFERNRIEGFDLTKTFTGRELHRFLHKFSAAEMDENGRWKVSFSNEVKEVLRLPS